MAFALQYPPAMKIRVTGAPRPGMVILFAVIAWGAWSHRPRSAPAEPEGVWAAPAPFAHTASVPFSLARLNPFHRTKELEFVLSEAQTVEISVFDGQGILLKHWPAGTYSAGRNSISWDACDAAGHEVPRGVYLVRYDFGGTWSLRRLLLVGGMA